MCLGVSCYACFPILVSFLISSAVLVPAFIWKRWENPYGMEITDQGRIKTADGVLSLMNVEESDGGNYTCHVENLSGSKSRSVWFVIASK